MNELLFVQGNANMINHTLFIGEKHQIALLHFRPRHCIPNTVDVGADSWKLNSNHTKAVPYKARTVKAIWSCTGIAIGSTKKIPCLL